MDFHFLLTLVVPAHHLRKDSLPRFCRKLGVSDHPIKLAFLFIGYCAESGKSQLHYLQRLHSKRCRLQPSLTPNCSLTKRVKSVRLPHLRHVQRSVKTKGVGPLRAYQLKMEPQFARH